MNDILELIKNYTLSLDPATILVTGVLAIVLGLFLWLGGLKYSTFVAGLLGALVGGVLGMFVSSWVGFNMTIGIAGGAAVIALIAIAKRKTIILLLAILIFAGGSGVAYMGLNVDSKEFKERLNLLRQKAQAYISSGRQLIKGSNAADTDNQPSSAEENYLRRLANSSSGLAMDNNGADQGMRGRAREKFHDTMARLRVFASEHGAMLIVYITVGAVVGWVLAYLLRTVVMALCCSIVGTTLTIIGTMMVVLYKSSDALNGLQQPEHKALLPTIFAAMVVFGWLSQLLLARGSSARKEAEED